LIKSRGLETDLFSRIWNINFHNAVIRLNFHLPKQLSQGIHRQNLPHHNNQILHQMTPRRKIRNTFVASSTIMIEKKPIRNRWFASESDVIVAMLNTIQYNTIQLYFTLR
jgi:hypothetical protein